MQYEPAYYIGKYRRYIIMGVILLVLLITGATIWYNLQLAEQRRGKLAVPVDVVPNDANVVLSTGQQLPSRGTAYISPGNYNVTVSKQGFASQTRPLRVTQDAVPYITSGSSALHKKQRTGSTLIPKSINAFNHSLLSKIKRTIHCSNPIIRLSIFSLLKTRTIQ